MFERHRKYHGRPGRGGQGGLQTPLASDCKWRRTLNLQEKRRERGEKKENGKTRQAVRRGKKAERQIDRHKDWQKDKQTVRRTK